MCDNSGDFKIGDIVKVKEGILNNLAFKSWYSVIDVNDGCDNRFTVIGVSESYLKLKEVNARHGGGCASPKEIYEKI